MLNIAVKLIDPTMRFLPTLIHGILDYLIGIFIIASPWIFGYYHNGPETWGPVIIVAAIFLYDLLTDYESGLIKLIPMPAHLWFDLVCGLVLIFSPWLFSFADIAHYPQLILGICVILNSLLSEFLPPYAGKGGGD